jgi:hypothetical protein
MIKDKDVDQKGGAVKLSILLTEDQAGDFPVSSETIWCIEEGEFFRVKNVPFFIDQVSFDDVISVRESADGFFEIIDVILPSSNSTIWLYFKTGSAEQAVLDKLIQKGCGVEGGVFDGYYAINVPGAVDIDVIYSVIDEVMESGKVLVDYPSIRH